MAALLILHHSADREWAVALAGALSEHAPVRYEIGEKTPAVQIGPSIFRIALWPGGAKTETSRQTFSRILGDNPDRAILVSRETAPPPAGLSETIANRLTWTDARSGVESLQEIIKRLDEALKSEASSRERTRDEQLSRKSLKVELLGWTALSLVVGAGILAFNTGGLRDALIQLLARLF